MGSLKLAYTHLETHFNKRTFFKELEYLALRPSLFEFSHGPASQNIEETNKRQGEDLSQQFQLQLKILQHGYSKDCGPYKLQLIE